jgi:hypothetical protein
MNKKRILWAVSVTACFLAESGKCNDALLTDQPGQQPAGALGVQQPVQILAYMPPMTRYQKLRILSSNLVAVWRNLESLKITEDALEKARSAFNATEKARSDLDEAIEALRSLEENSGRTTQTITAARDRVSNTTKTLLKRLAANAEALRNAGDAFARQQRRSGASEVEQEKLLAEMELHRQRSVRALKIETAFAELRCALYLVKDANASEGDAVENLKRLSSAEVATPQVLKDAIVRATNALKEAQSAFDAAKNAQMRVDKKIAKGQALLANV